MIKGIIVAHGDLARAFLDTAEKILGKQEAVEVLSNVNLSCDLLCEKINEKLSEDSLKKIIFVDLPGGSCAISCLNLIKENKDLYVICGMNLPMIIEFFLLREKYPPEELVPILIKKARDNIFELGGNSEFNR